MSFLLRRSSGAFVLVAVLLVPLAAAQTKELEAAVKLYEKYEYLAAQEALLKIDRDGLADAELEKLDALLKELPQAIKSHERAAQDLEQANAAYEAGDWNAAERAYRAVENNKYAGPAAHAHAAAQTARIAEKKRLAEAAKPSQPVEGSVAEQAAEPQTTAAPAPPAVTPAPVAPTTQPAAPAPEALPRRLTPTDELRMRDELLWQRAVAVAESLATEIRADMAASDFGAARKKLATAQQSIEAAARYAEPVSRYQTAKQGLLDLQKELDQAADAYAMKNADEQRTQIKRRIEERKKQVEQQKAETILQMFNSVEQLRRERRFSEAAEVLREILRIDPGNAEARYQLNWAEDLESFDQQSRWQHDVDVQRRQALINAEEALIPWDVDIMYPRNWLELSAQRARMGVAIGRDFGDIELAKQLDRTQPDFRFEETPFEQVVSFLKEMSKINIAVDWTDLTDAGIERDKPVTVQLSNVTLKTVLNEVLTQVGGETQLAYTIGDGLLRIATKTKLDRDKLVMIYDIRDLLVQVRDAPQTAGFDVTRGLGQGGGGGGGGGGGSSSGMFGQGGGQQGGQQGGGNQGDQQQGRQQLVDQITDIIRQTVEPDSWRETASGEASVRELNGQLIIYNTSDAHTQVGDLLTQLREARAMQVSVETRFLNVVSNFLEEFGVDLDFVFNAGNAGFDQAQSPQGGVMTDPATGAILLVPRDYSRIGALPAAPGFGTPFGAGTLPLQSYQSPGLVPAAGGIIPQSDRMTPIGMQQGSMGIAIPNVATGVPGSFGSQAGLTPALNIAGSFLDNLQVDFLIRATQANSRSSIVQAPRLVMFNGQASTISVGRSRTYVASLEPRLAEQAVGFRPQTAQADSGVGMWVQSTISADRRYVTLSLNIQQRDPATFDRFEVQRASGNSPGAFILLPDQSFVRLVTAVSVPDGGTVLLGGLKQVGEVEVEAGVPILSKIPILKRAFTNQTTVKDTRTLLVLVKTKIILQKEAEDEAFPTFTQSGT